MVGMNCRKWARLYCSEALKEQNNRCLYCKEPMTVARATADHLHPRTRGGKTNKENIVAACRFCNQAKSDWHETRFFKAITAKHPPARSDLAIIWAGRRIWKRAHKAIDRIQRSVAISA